jgi:hypothetical protein
MNSWACVPGNDQVGSIPVRSCKDSTAQASPSSSSARLRGHPGFGRAQARPRRDPSPRPQNLARLQRAIGKLHARRTDRQPLEVGSTPERAPVIALTSDAGEIKMIPQPAGTAATTTCASGPAANRSDMACAPGSPARATSSECSRHTTEKPTRRCSRQCAACSNSSAAGRSSGRWPQHAAARGHRASGARPLAPEYARSRPNCRRVEVRPIRGRH